MIRPWQIAVGFAVCVALAFAAMMAVTSNALQLDRDEQLSRLRAELEERIGGALWTMDAEVSSLLAEELARPARDFTLEQTPSVKGKVLHDSLSPPAILPPPGEPPSLEAMSGAPSPSKPNDDLILVRFRVDIDNNWQTPACWLGPRDAGEKHTGNSLAPPPTNPDAEIVAPTNRTEEEQHAARDPDDIGEQTLRKIRSVVDFRQLALALPLPNDVRDRLELADTEPLAPRQQRLVNNAYLPQQAALRNDLRQRFGPDPEGLAQQQAVPQQDLEVPNPNDYLNSFRNRRSQQEQSQNTARNSLIVRRLEAVQAILTAERSSEEKWSNTLWVGDQLVLARLTLEDDSALILGACLDWRRLRERLKQRVGDALQDFELEPIQEENEVLKHRSLATLPVRLVTPPIDNGDVETWSPIRLTLALAWLFLSLASLAVGALLIGAVQLSERRASFVAAVTHELRSPLTTFQLYTEMLLGGMVAPNDRTTYLRTLKAESERLAHLVDNVLQFSRLERGKAPSCDHLIDVAELMARIAPRLEERLRQASMKLQIDDLSDNASIRTDPGAVEQILYNLADNASKYASHGEPPRLDLTWSVVNGRLVAEVRDYGPGIEDPGQLFRPFSKSVGEAAESSPGVGLGLALCHRLARQLGGSLSYQPVAVEPRDEHFSAPLQDSDPSPRFPGARFLLDLGPTAPPS